MARAMFSVFPFAQLIILITDVLSVMSDGSVNGMRDRSPPDEDAGFFGVRPLIERQHVYAGLELAMCRNQPLGAEDCSNEQARI